MNYSGDMRWSLWAMAAHGLGDSRSGTGGQTGSTDSSSSSRSDGSGGRSSGGGGIGPGGSGASDPSGGRSGGSSSSSSGSKSTGNSSSGKSSSSNSNSSGGKSAGNGSDGKESGKSSSASSARGSVGGDGPATGSTGKSTSNSTAGKSTTSRSSSGLGDKDGGGYNGTSVGRQSSSSSSSSRSSGKSTLSASQESNLSSRLSGAVDASTGRSLTESASGKTGRVGGGLAVDKSGLSAAQESNPADRLGSVSTTTGRIGATTTAADKTNRVGGGLAVGATSLTPAQDRNLSDRLGDIRTGKNLMAPALEANVADRLGSPSARTATGFATSARAAEDMSIGALREEQAKSAKNYGLGFAAQARAAEDKSMSKQRAIEDALSFISQKEAQRAVNPGTGKVDPYNGLVGGRRSPTHADLENMTIAEVQDYQKGMISRGHLSTAVGKYQMIAETLADQVKRSNIDPNTTRFTKSVQDELAVGLLDNRARQAMVNGVVDPEKFANRLAAEWASFQQSNGRGRYDRDGINTATVPYSSVLETATELSSTGAINGVTSARGSKGGRVESTKGDLPATGPMPSGRPGPTPTSRSSALASTMNISADVRAAAERRGVDPVAVAEYAERYGMDAETAAFAVTPQNQVAGYRDPEARTIAGAPAVYSPPSQGDIAQPVTQAPAAAPAPARERFATKYLGATPANVPTPASRPNALANEAPATAAVPAERSLPDKVLAGAIDAGVGMIPGVGMAAGVYGLAAPMLGLPTIGDAALAVRDTNQFDLKESLRNPSREGDGNDGTGLTAADGATQREAAGAPSTTVAGFESKYLAWRDPTPRPTPEERWGASGSTGGMPYGA